MEWLFEAGFWFTLGVCTACLLTLSVIGLVGKIINYKSPKDKTNATK